MYSFITQLLRQIMNEASLHAIMCLFSNSKWQKHFGPRTLK
jgi:hypothetical protein